MSGGVRQLNPDRDGRDAYRASERYRPNSAEKGILDTCPELRQMSGRILTLVYVRVEHGRHRRLA
jgi:hypothetical protein